MNFLEQGSLNDNCSHKPLSWRSNLAAYAAVAALTLSVTTLDVPDDVPNDESKDITNSCSSLPPKLFAANVCAWYFAKSWNGVSSSSSNLNPLNANFSKNSVRINSIHRFKKSFLGLWIYWEWSQCETSVMTH